MPLFESLTERLGDVFDRLKRRGALSEDDVSAALREVRVALLEADVALPVVRDFVAAVQERAVGQEVVKSVTPGQMVVKIVHDQLIEMLGGSAVEIDLNAPAPVAILVVGLQGSGKTTTTAKVGHHLADKQKKRVLMASLDVRRPAAQEQLRVLGDQALIPTLDIRTGEMPVAIARRAMDQARREGYDVVLLDTAGRLAIDDAIVLFVAPGWSGLARNTLSCSIGGKRAFDSEVAHVAYEHRMTREDRDRNGEKLGLVRLDPLMTDRQWLRLEFEEMRYFDFEGPRRALWIQDEPTDFANKFYLGKDIPEEIPTPLACVQGVIVTRDDFLVLGIRRRATKSDFPEYDDRLCVTFEEQMRPDDGDVHGTMKRGLKEEAGIGEVEDAQIEVIAVHYESSFSAVCIVAVVRLECTSHELSQSVLLEAKDHEWDPIFVHDDLQELRPLLKEESVAWKELGATHFLKAFTPLPSYRWHGSSRFRLFAHLAMQYGIGRLLRETL